MISIRTYNRNKIIKTLKKSKKWNEQFIFFNQKKNLRPSWFGLPLLVNSELEKHKDKFLKFLNKNNLETRPIISGNFINQPAINLYDIKFKKSELKNSNIIDKRGFFIGLPTIKLSQEKADKISNLLLSLSNLK